MLSHNCTLCPSDTIDPPLNQFTSLHLFAFLYICFHHFFWPHKQGLVNSYAKNLLKYAQCIMSLPSVKVSKPTSNCTWLRPCLCFGFLFHDISRQIETRYKASIFNQGFWMHMTKLISSNLRFAIKIGRWSTIKQKQKTNGGFKRPPPR